MGNGERLSRDGRARVITRARKIFGLGGGGFKLKEIVRMRRGKFGNWRTLAMAGVLFLSFGAGAPVSVAQEKAPMTDEAKERAAGRGEL
jgi:hypothetical protein